MRQLWTFMDFDHYAKKILSLNKYKSPHSSELSELQKQVQYRLQVKDRKTNMMTVKK